MIADTSARAIAAGVRSGRFRAEEVLERTLADITRANPSLNAFLALSAERARGAAAAVSERVAKGADPGPLAGVPVAVKDNLATCGLDTTCASRMLAGHRPVYDATVVTRLEAAGALIVGKTNMDEFGMGSSTETSAFGPTRNPWDANRVPGGSSGGSAAAVAAGLVPLALGSDTGGSVRQPAAFCGLVGLKPTYGRVSRYGLVAYASSLDQVGVLARDAGDAALALSVIEGSDPADMTSHDAPAATRTDAPERVGVPMGLLDEGVEASVRTSFHEALAAWREQGVEAVDVPFVDPEVSLAAYYVVACAEASSNLARYDGVRYGRRVEAPDLDGMIRRTRTEGFGEEVRRRILLGTYVLSSGYYDAYYRRAMQLRRHVQRATDEALRNVTAIALPTAPAPAFRLGERTTDPLRMMLSDLFTIVPNLTSHPALSLPGPVATGALPVGVQLIGRRDGEADLLALASRLDDATRFSARRPPVGEAS